MRGQRSALVRMVAFSMDMRSLGRFSLFHRAIVAPSVRRERMSSPSVRGIAGCVSEWVSITYVQAKLKVVFCS